MDQSLSKPQADSTLIFLTIQEFQNGIKMVLKHIFIWTSICYEILYSKMNLISSWYSVGVKI